MDACPGTVEHLSRAPQAVPGERQFRELVFREKHAWVQVIVDENDAVTRFSITVTDPKFRFPTRNLTGGHLTVKLGSSRFSDIRTGFRISGRSLRIAAHNHEYAEAYWFGNPGNYQHYVLSSNEIGTGEFGFSIARQGPASHSSGILEPGKAAPVPRPQSFDPDAGYALQFRAETTINTLTVLGPGHPPEELAEPRGPAANQVRVLVPGRREQRRTRRRIRRVNRQILRAGKRQAPSRAVDDIAREPAQSSPAHEESNRNNQSGARNEENWPASR
jgi:hypothetical protein